MFCLGKCLHYYPKQKSKHLHAFKTLEKENKGLQVIIENYGIWKLKETQCLQLKIKKLEYQLNELNHKNMILKRKTGFEYQQIKASIQSNDCIVLKTAGNFVYSWNTKWNIILRGSQTVLQRLSRPIYCIDLVPFPYFPYLIIYSFNGREISKLRAV